MKKKSYKLTCGLQEGYAEKAKTHTLKQAGKMIETWLADRLTANSPVVTGLLQEGTLFFPAKNDRQKITASPTAIFTGELATPEDLKRKNKEVKQTLEALAKTLKEKLKQEEVYIIYRDQHWCV